MVVIGSCPVQESTMVVHGLQLLETGNRIPLCGTRDDGQYSCDFEQRVLRFCCSRQTMDS